MTTLYSLIDAAALAAWLHDGAEIAFVDVREEGLFGEGHALLASNVPYSRLEVEFPARVPRHGTRTVLVGEARPDGVSTAQRAAQRLHALGYRQLHVLNGGIEAWAAAGHRLFEGIHVPSKAFAEVVEHHFHTPAIAAEELHRQQLRGEDVIVLDSRTTAEFERFHVPGAVSCPSAELVLRVRDLVPSPSTRIVVSCAGRTRGIIGAQALINAGISNPVAALEGGTQGWKLAGLPIEKGPTARYGDVSAAALQDGSARAARLAHRFAVPEIDAQQLRAWQNDPARTTYLIDVRTPAEYAAGHLPGAIAVAGGQLVQTLDRWVATRGARLVLADDLAVRAQVTAHWLRQLGWDAVVLRFAPADAQATGAPQAAESTTTPQALAAVQAAALLAQGVPAVSADDSATYRRGHPRGALWLNRSRVDTLPAALRAAPKLLVFGHDAATAQLLADELAAPGTTVQVVAGDAAAWAAAGIAVDATPDTPADAQRVDFLFWLHDRHTGNAEASRAYLAWEAGLPAAIGSPQQAGFRLFPLPAQT